MGLPNSADLERRSKRRDPLINPDQDAPVSRVPVQSVEHLEDGEPKLSANLGEPGVDVKVDSKLEPRAGGDNSGTENGDGQILARAQAGDHVAFAQLYALHKRRVYSLCLRMLSNVAEAEDLTQEAFLQLHRKIATFRGDSAFSTWLHRLTINVVLMHLRRKGLNLISLDEALDPSPEYGPVRSFGAPDLRLTGSIDRMTLEKAVETLPAGYRLIFVLHDIEGYEHNEIATLLDCSIGNSKSQLHKARMKLREALRAPADEEVAK
jgi:RNA polymerase sigma-70 factor (ECF subfamily)